MAACDHAGSEFGGRSAHQAAAAFDDALSRATVPSTGITNWPLGFGPRAEVNRWIDEQHLLWFVGVADDPVAPNAASVMWRREQRAS